MSDEEVIKKRRFKIKEENERKKEMKMMVTDEMKKKGRRCMFILKWKIFILILQVNLHLSPTVFLQFSLKLQFD